MKPDTSLNESEFQDVQARKHWMSVLARAEASQLEEAVGRMAAAPRFHHLRQPEVGMVMVQGRAEATGDRFNLGEMTVSRCSLKLEGGAVGHGYVAGRSKRHAELAALFDALLQCPELGPGIMDSVINPLHAGQVEQRREKAAKTAATRVNFFTMVRGED